MLIPLYWSANMNLWPFKNRPKRLKLGVFWCCRNHRWFPFVLRCGYCSVLIVFFSLSYYLTYECTLLQCKTKNYAKHCQLETLLNPAKIWNRISYFLNLQKGIHISYPVQSPIHGLLPVIFKLVWSWKPTNLILQFGAPSIGAILNFLCLLTDCF